MNFELLLQKLGHLLQQGKANEVIMELESLYLGGLTFYQFHQLLGVLPAKVEYRKKLRIAIGSRTNLDQFVEALIGFAKINFVEIEVYLIDSNVLYLEILNENSKLYQFCPDIVWFFQTKSDLMFFDSFTSVSQDTRFDFINRYVNDLKDVITFLNRKCKSQIILNLFETSAERVFGNFESIQPNSQLSLIRSLNSALIQLGGLVCYFDLDYVSSLYGKNKWFVKKHWYLGQYPFDLSAIPFVCQQAIRFIFALIGLSKKVLVLDLDNTIWPGFAGEGAIVLENGEPESKAFIDFQRYIKSLQSKGVILAAVSKNDSQAVLDTFQNTSGMILQISDFAIIKANWLNKAENISQISAELNLSLDQFVFIDDSQFECEMVRSLLPEITVVHLPADPARLIESVDERCFFDSPLLVEEDLQRTSYYKADQHRTLQKSKFKNEIEYLNSLKMTIAVSSLSSKNAARCEQLINKTNQFNLTGKRITAHELQDTLGSPQSVLRCYSLSDIFGDAGIISAVSTTIDDSQKTLTIDIWVMSCRVFKRTVESFIILDLIEFAESKNLEAVIGQFVPTGKNEIVRDLFKNLGFKSSPDGSNWKFLINRNEFRSKIQTLISRSEP